ncbi:MAG: hypothetical protein PHY15_00200 [Eubacteriales bacterium]|nr:hypothetical protein [Eubacteriales bacterium]MDD4475529.1 hypothetical protein [Eubacteriales bacterium]
MQNAKTSAKKILSFFAAILLITFTVSACRTEPVNTSSAGQGAQISITDSGLYYSYLSYDNNIPSYYESIYEYSEQTSSMTPFVPPEIAPSVVTETNGEAPEGYKSVRITFMDENPIHVDMVVPESLTIEANNDEVVNFGIGFCKPIGIYFDGEIIGGGYDAVFSIPNADDYLGIYHYIRGIHVNWIEDYSEVRKDDKSAAALSTIYSWWPPSMSDFLSGVSPSENGYYETRTDVVLSYNKDVQKFVGFTFGTDLIPDEQLETIAKSIVLSAAE